MLKRFFDVICSVFGLLILWPLLLVLALAIKVGSPGPVFYRGRRVGRHGKPFFVLKFRSMVVNAEQKGASSTTQDDVRVTRIGRVMRKYKLDELPQLFNVLRGEMSLVGPRPEVQRFVDLYTDAERIILQVRPGITDRASIRFHNEGEILAASGIQDPDEAYAKLIRPEKLRLQQEYVRQCSLGTDLRILVATLGTLVRTRALRANTECATCSSNNGSRHGA